MAGRPLVLVALCGLSLAVADPTFTSSSDTLLLGITQSLTFTCNADREQNLMVPQDLSIFFTKAATTNKQLLAKYIPAIGVLPNNNHPTNVTAKGNQTDNNSHTSLEIKISSPSQEYAGLYECVVHGMDANFIPHTYQKDQTVTFQADTNTYVGKRLMELEDKVKEMENRWNQVDASSIFHKSIEFNKRHYLLSRSVVDHISLAQFMCTVEGGYLAEVDDEREFNVVKKFAQDHLQSISDADVFLGATDQGHQGQWKFMQNENNKPFLKWGGFASSGYDCLVLSQSVGYLMNDFDCNQPTRFMCEIPH